MENIISSQQIELIKENIQTELLKRGITAQIIKLEEYEHNRSRAHYINLRTENFQTTPIIFKRLWVEAFGTAITKRTNEEGKEYYSVWICVHYSYEHFGGGTNGCELFDFTCSIVQDKPDYIFSESIK